MKLAVVGSRTFSDRGLAFTELAKFLDKHPDLTIVSGGARGADTFAKEFAFTNGLDYIEHLPDWDRYGRSAGFKRNWLIWEDADEGVAFWDGVSKGTAHSFSIAKSQGKRLTVVNYTAELI